MRNEKRSVSIILPTYNRSNLLKKCISSVLSQTYPNWELIISDDGSTDDTASIIEDIIKKDDRIRYHRNAINQGLPRNRNIAILIAKNDLVFFIEDDLILEKNCLEILVNTYIDLKNKGKNVGAVAPRLITQDFKVPRMDKFITKKKERNKISYVSKLDKKTGNIIVNYGAEFNEVVEAPNVHACTMYPKSILGKMGGYEENAYKGHYGYEETDLNFRIKKKGYKLYFQSKAVAYHIKASKGGCRVSSQIKVDYYLWRNHIIFLIRIFGIRSLYMVPLFVLYLLSQITKYVFLKVKKMTIEVMKSVYRRIQ
jgi:glycosyltransferase involved in cell wall biosynthesis